MSGSARRAGLADEGCTSRAGSDFQSSRQAASAEVSQSLSCTAGQSSSGTRCKTFLFLFLFLSLLCGGCGSDAATDQKDGDKAKSSKDEKEKRNKPELEFLALSTRPTDHAITVPHIKPGHWIEASQQMVANYEDFKGELEVEPVPLPGVPFALGTTRDVVLAKTQIKSIPLMVYAPVGPRRPSFEFELRDTASGRAPVKSLNPMIRLPAHQFFFTVLTPEPTRFQFLRTLDSIVPPTSIIMPQGEEAHYRVMTPLVDNNLALPSHFLTSTAVAYVLWDDVDPSALTPDQKTALLDWIHWGGQLIINGPQTLDTLEGSFLAAYLPADGDGVVDLPAEAVNQAFNQAWKTGDLELMSPEAWPVQRMIPRAGSQTLMEIDDLPMVVERRAGRGRVVATAFTLAQRDLIVWPDFDGFFNATILRRHPRSFQYDEFSSMSVTWGKQYISANEFGNSGINYHRSFDPRKNSQVRLFTRDAQTYDANGTPYQEAFAYQAASQNPYGNGYVSELDQMENSPGVAGWQASNHVARLVLESLIAAAGIEVPRASFVMWMLSAYLVVLVPLNWAVFKALGRVEWAWIAAPVITLVFALVVVRLAQLNIGFARAQTEIGIVEIQNGYDRAHISRYTAFYTSLGTNYQFELDDVGAVARPLAFGERMFQGQRVQNLEFTRGSTAELTGFSVASNSLGILETEGMFDLAGGIELRDTGTAWQVENKTGLELRNVGVVAEGRFGWVAELPGNGTAMLETRAFDDKAALRNVRRQYSGDQPSDDDALDVQKIIDLAETDAVRLGETRLVAVHDGPLPGVTVVPESDQTRSTMVVVAHLNYKPFDDPGKDKTSRPEAERAWKADGFSSARRLDSGLVATNPSTRDAATVTYTNTVDND